jgi:hypothetical protein
MFPAVKQNLGGHKFKDDRYVETVVTTMADSTGHRQKSPGKRKARLAIRQMYQLQRGECGKQ